MRCNPCSKDFCKRTITDHLRNQHEASKVMVRGWHIRKDATNLSRFQLAWERKRNSMQGTGSCRWPHSPSSCVRPLPPGDGEDSGDAANDAARFYSTPLSPETQTRWKPDPRRRQQQDHLLTVFVKDVGGSKILFLLKTDWWFGWTDMQNLCAPSRGVL